MIQLNQVNYRYQQQAMLFDLHIQRGERVAVLGPSGAGKSTLLNIIAGFLLAENGTITLAGQDHSNTAPSQRPVSMLFQENNLFAHLTILQNLGLGLDTRLRLTATQQQQLDEIAERVGISHCLSRLPATLSGGQRQRAALARCLLRRQPILLLDEPFSALDDNLRSEMLQLVAQVCQERDLALLMVSHNLNDAVSIAPRSLVVAEGKIAFNGTTQQLLDAEGNTALSLLSKIGDT